MLPHAVAQEGEPERDQRGRETTLCGGGRLAIPPNLLVIGTLDTSDASAPEASLALRQRFAHLMLELEGESEGASRRSASGVGPAD